MPTQSSQFSQVYCGDATNTLQEISQYVKSVNIPQDNVATTLTTHATGGGPVTEQVQKGARTANVQVEVFMDPAVLLILNQILGALNGSTWQFRNGNNAAPAVGDMLYQGTFTLFSMALTYNPGTEATWMLDLRPTDQGAIVPGWAIA